MDLKTLEKDLRFIIQVQGFPDPLILQLLGWVIWKIIIIKLILFSKLSHLGFNLKI